LSEKDFKASCTDERTKDTEKEKKEEIKEEGQER